VSVDQSLESEGASMSSRGGPRKGLWRHLLDRGKSFIADHGKPLAVGCTLGVVSSFVLICVCGQYLGCFYQTFPGDFQSAVIVAGFSAISGLVAVLVKKKPGWGLSGLAVGALLTILAVEIWLVFLVVPRSLDGTFKNPQCTLNPISTLTPTSISTPTPTLTSTPAPPLLPTPSPTPTLVPYLTVVVQQLNVYSGPGEMYDVMGEVHRGDRLPLSGRSADGTWWQVDYLGRSGWVPAQPVGANIEPTLLPTAKAPPTPATTPMPTEEPTPSLPEPNTVLGLQNPGFERVQENVIPGWHWWAADNYPDEEYDSQSSFDTPFFSRTQDPARMIDGSTLQIEATAFVNFRVHVFQTVSAPPSVTVRFQASAKAYSNDGLKLAAGIDPNGGPDCSQAHWGDTLTVGQSGGTVQLIAPDVVVGRDGRVTVCLRAENILPARSNAAFFDKAALIANPE
jgi:hypothetical protein